MLCFRRDSQVVFQSGFAFDACSSCVGEFLSLFQPLVVVFLLVSTILSLSLYQLESCSFMFHVVSCFPDERNFENTLPSSSWLPVHLLLWGSNLFPLFFNGSFVFLLLICKPSWYLLLSTSPLLDSYNMYCIFLTNPCPAFSVFFLMASFDEKKF